mgnify:CR=1 FL=1
MEESDYIQIIYKIANDSSCYGLGNCMKTTKRITQKLSTGAVDPISFSDRFPGNIEDTGREIEYNLGETPEEFWNKINEFLGEGQHCQVFVNMVGYLKEKAGISHFFNAIKLEGNVKLIDTYKGWSYNSWLNQSWNNPKNFIQSFKNFEVSRPEMSFYAWNSIKCRNYKRALEALK